MKKQRSEDLVPFDHIGPDYAVTAYGYVLFGVSLDFLEAYTMADVSSEGTSSEAVEFYHKLKSSFATLSEGSIVQKITDVYTLPYEDTTFKKSLTQKWNKEMYQKRDVVFLKNYVLISYPYRAVKKTEKPNGLFARMEKFAGIERLGEYRNNFESFVSNIREISMDFNKLSGNDLLELYVKMWNGGEGELTDRLNEIQVNENTLSIGSNLVTVLSSVKLPTVFDGFSSSNRSGVPSKKIGNNTRFNNEVGLPTSYLFPIGAGFPVKHTLIETIRIEDNERVDALLDSAKMKLNFLIGIKYGPAIKKERDIAAFKDAKTEHGLKVVTYGVTILLYGDSLKALQEQSNLLINKANNELDLVLVNHNTNLFKSFYATLPGCGNTSTNLRMSFLEVVVYMMHIESFKKSNAEGIILTDMFGKPFVFDFWDEKNKYVEARNMLVFGPTGQGKSVCMNHLLDQSFWNGEVVFIIDVGGSYKRITSLNKGVYVDSSIQENLSFNPFLDCYKNEFGNYFPDLDINGGKDSVYLDFLSTLLLSCAGLSSGSGAASDVIKKSVQAYFNFVNEQKALGGAAVLVGFDSYHEFLTGFFEYNKKFLEYINADEFLFVTEKFKSSGQFGFLLNGVSGLDINNRWICFDLVGIKNMKDVAQPVFLIVINLFEKIMKVNFGNRVGMYIDEAVDFLKGEIMGDYIGGLYRKIRKQGGRVAIITQSIDFLDGLNELVRNSIFANSEIKILLNHAKSSYLFPQIKRDLSLTSSEMKLLENQTPGGAYRIGFMKFGSMKGFLFRIEISTQTYSLYQTNADDIKKIDELIEGCSGNIEEAVQEFIDSRFDGSNELNN
jgi:hypothetical protein